MNRPRRISAPLAADCDWLVPAILTLVNLALVWSFPYFVSVDGGAHVNNALILSRYSSEGFEFYHDFYLLNLQPNPNWFSHGALALLIHAVSAPAAEKLLVSMHLVLWPIAWMYALRGARQSGGWLVVAAMPLALSWYLRMGFYNFVFSLDFLLFGIGFWLRWSRRGGIAQCLMLIGISLVTYFCHPMSLAMLWLIVSVLVVWRFLSGSRATRRRTGREAIWTLAAALPTIGLMTWYGMQPKFPAHEAAGIYFVPEKLLALVTLYQPIVNFGHAEDPIGWIYSLLFHGMLLGTIVAAFRGGRIRAANGFGFCWAAALLIFLIAPQSMGGGTNVVDRAAIYVVLGGILWIAASGIYAKRRRLLVSCFAVLAVATAALQLPAVMHFQNYYAEYDDLLAQIPRGSAALPLVLTREPATPNGRPLANRTNPLWHYSGHVAARNSFVDLSDYEGNTSYFPLRWREDRNPFSLIGDVNSPSPQLDLLSTGARIEYVLVWLSPGPGLSPQARESIIDQLDRGYRLIGRSRPNGYGFLYKRNE